jgi:hypothetical protein
VPDADRADAPTEDLARIVIRAGRLGFSVSRVATALGISPRGLASLQHRVDASARGRGLDDHHPEGSTTRRPHHA